MGIICDRLTKWSDMNEHIIEEQAGFRGGYSTIDNIFIVNSISMRYLSKKLPHSFLLPFLNKATIIAVDQHSGKIPV
jgi:hypothetical protein